MLIPESMGVLSSPEMQKRLAQAQKQPDRWVIALIPTSGKRRTPAQNRLYRSFLAQLAQTQGRSAEYWHQWFVEKFLGFQDILGEDGYTRRVLRSTTELTIAEFNSYLSACFAWAEENNLRN